LANSTARIEPFIRDKVLILSLLRAIFRAVSLQRSLKRAPPYRLGSRSRSIINGIVFGFLPARKAALLNRTEALHFDN
jgi:hypothetical protein